MFHRIVGFSAVVLGLPLAIACQHSSTHASAPSTPPPAQPVATEGAPATGPECEENPQTAPAPAHAAKAAKMQHRHVLNCPMEIPGTVAAFTEVDGNPAIEFRTTGDVIQLRKRVHAFLEPQDASGAVAPGVSADTQGAGGTQMKPDIAYIGAKTRFDDVTGGVRVTYVPADDGQLAALHAQVSAQVAKLDSGDCSDMHIHGVKLKSTYQPAVPPEP
jgi:hypothetical protein